MPPQGSARRTCVAADITAERPLVLLVHENGRSCRMRGRLRYGCAAEQNNPNSCTRKQEKEAELNSKGPHVNVSLSTVNLTIGIYMLLEQTLEKLNAMKLFGLAQSLKERLERHDHQSLDKAAFVGLLVDDEWLYRENRKLTTRLRVAKFKDRTASIQGVDYKTARGLHKEQLLELAQNRWITAHQSILITGLSGSGKSFLAQALGQHACRSGFTVQYFRLPTLLNLFVQARAEGTYERLLKRLSKLSFIVLDDFGLSNLTDREKQDLLEALEERYGTWAIVITAQLPISDWHDYLGGGRVADAILDRLVHHAHRIELRSDESMRRAYAAGKHDGHPVE